MSLMYSDDFSNKVLFPKLNTMIAENKRSVRTLKEEVQKLDELYQQKVKVRSPLYWIPCHFMCSRALLLQS